VNWLVLFQPVLEKLTIRSFEIIFSQMEAPQRFSRRKILQAALGFAGALTLKPYAAWAAFENEFPDAAHLGRICWGPTEVKARPDVNSQTVATLYEDSVVACLREIVGTPLPYRRSRRWIETPEGYIWSPVIQPVKNVLNPDTASWVESHLADGKWVEVTVPWVDVQLANTAPVSHWLRYRQEHQLPWRLYYSQVLWVDQLRKGDNGDLWVRVNEKYGNPGDMFWAPAEVFRPILDDEITPIHPEAENKRIVVDLSNQSLTCFEQDEEVYFCRISSGNNVYGVAQDKYLTPLGNFPIWGKYLSTHMAGGTAVAGWDLPGVGWVSLFFQNGQAIHSTFWHNNFGEEMSNGCVNASPQDSKWIFRWSLPQVGYSPGMKTIQGYSGTTMISILET
jgi:lipoprotein-anchoring transpeptidase ErfK/SrfK